MTTFKNKSATCSSIIAAGLLFLGSPLTHAAERVSGIGQIQYVVDGDTYKLAIRDARKLAIIRKTATPANIKGNAIRMRMLGIDTEESVHTDAGRNSAFGKHTSDFVKNELTGATVNYTCEGAGRYGRPLCSISVNGTDYGARLISLGLSPYLTKYGNHPWLDTEYRMAERSAQARKIGIWGVSKLKGGHAASSSTSQHPTQGPVPAVKKSTSGICHSQDSMWYAKTKRFVAFNSVADCLQSGGRLPRN